MLVTIGNCNCCGRCCEDIAGNRCEHLLVKGKIGQPDATSCRVYSERYHGMPLKVLDRKGKIVYDSVCYASGTQEETLEIAKRGINRGCSLKVIQIDMGMKK